MDSAGVRDSDSARVAGEEVCGAGVFGKRKDHIGLLDNDAANVPLGRAEANLR